MNLRSWLLIAFISALIQNLNAQCFFTVSPSNSTTACYVSEEDVVWNDNVNVTVSTNNLTKITAAGWNGGASSTASVYNYGYIYTVADQTTYDRFLGLSSTNPDANYTGIQFAIYLTSASGISIYESAANRGAFGTYAIGDTLKIAMEFGRIKYYKNSTLLYISNVTPSATLIADVSLNQIGAKLSKVVIGNLTDGSFTATSTNAGTSPTYQWKLNGSNVGTNSNSYSNTSLNTNDIVTCDLTYGTGGCSTGTITSNSIKIKVTSPSWFEYFYLSPGDTASGCFYEKTPVIWDHSATFNLKENSNSLTKIQSGGAWDGGGASLNYVYNNGYAYTIASETNTQRMFGLSTTNTNSNYTSIQYAIYLVNTAAIQIYESGIYIGTFGTYATGDTLKILVDQNKVKYFKNSIELYESATSPILPLLVDVSLNTNASTLNNVNIVNYTNGKINAIVTNGGASPTYQWYLNGSASGTNNSLYSFNPTNNDQVYCKVTPNLVGCSSLTNTSQTVTYTSPATNQPINFYISTDAVSTGCLMAKEKANFTDLVYVITSSNNITKTYNSAAWNAGAASTNQLRDNSYAYTVVSETNTNRVFGLSSTNANALNTSIQFGFYMVNNATLQIIESGTSRGTFGTYATGDTLKIASESSKIRYYKNSTFLYESAIAPTLPLIVDVSLGAQNATLKDITLVNLTQSTFTAISSNSGTHPHYYWKLNGSSVASDTSVYTNNSLNAGDTVTCELTPNLNGCLTATIPSHGLLISAAPVANNTKFYILPDTASKSCIMAKQKANITDNVYVTAIGNNITKTYNTANWDAGAATLNKVYNNGYAYTVIAETNTYRAFGLSSSNANVNYTSIQYAVYLVNNGTLTVYESGVNRAIPATTYAIGDTIKVAVENNVVKYYKNSIPFYQSAVVPTLPLVVDMSIYTNGGTLKQINTLNSSLCKFNVNPVNVGTTPQYQWVLNGNNVGTDTSYYYNSNIKLGDSLVCKLTPNLNGCTTTQATSNTINFQASPVSNNFKYYISADTTSYSCLQSKQKVRFTDLTNVYVNDNSITKFANTNAWDAGATSLEKVYNNGQAFTIISETNTYRVFGLSSTNANVNYNSIQYGFYLNNNGTYNLVESGTNVNNPNPNTYASGDTLKIVIDQSKVKYFKNSILVFQSTVIPTLPMLVDMSIYSVNGTLKKVNIINASKCIFNASVTGAGTNPHYQWLLNGANAGTDTSYYSNSNIISGDSVYCMLTPTLDGCSASQTSSNAVNFSNAPVSYLSKLYLSVDSTSNACLQTNQKVSFTDVTRVYTSGNSITKSVNTGAWDAGAASLNKVNNNSYAYTVINETNTYRSFGLSSSNLDANYTSIQFGYYLNNNGTCNITESGTNVYGGLTYAIGDTLKVAVENGKIRYYKNSTLLYQSLSNPVLPLIVDVSLYSINSNLRKINIVNGTQCKLNANVSNVGINPHYQWVYNGANVGTDTSYYNNSNIVAGDSVYCKITPTFEGCNSTQVSSTAVNYNTSTINNNIKFYVSVDTTSNGCLLATQKASFTDMTNVTNTGNDLVKYYNVGGWNSGAATYNSIYNNGYAYTVVAETNTSRMFGLSSTNADADYTTIQYALYLVNDGSLYIYETGNNRGSFGTYSTGDTLKIAVELGKIHYYKNSSLLYESAILPGLPLLVDVSLNTINSTLKNITIANITKCSFKANATNAGSTPAYEWKVNGVVVGSNSSTYSSSSLNATDVITCGLTPNLAGCNNTKIISYPVTLSTSQVSNAAKFYLATDTSTYSCLLAKENVKFTDITNISINNNNITKFANSGGWDAGVASLNKVNNNSYAYTIVAETNTERYFGLSNTNADATNTSIQYAFYLVNTGALQIVESGAGRGTFGTYTTGDTLKIAIESGYIRYYKNSTLLYESDITPTLPLIVDVSLRNQNCTLNSITIVNATQCRFYAIASNVGSSPSYQWKLNNTNVGTNSYMYSNSALKATDTIQCLLTPDFPGCSAVQATTDPIILMDANVSALAKLSIVPDNAVSTCLKAKQKATFTDLLHISVSDNNLIKYLNGGAWDGGAASVTKAYDNSYVYTIVEETNTARMFGMSHSNTDGNYNTIQYAFFLQNDGSLSIYENGVGRIGVGTYVTGDTLKIAIEQGIIRYYKNSGYLYQSTITPTLPLILDVSLNTLNSTLKKITFVNNTLCSFTATYSNAGTPAFQWILNGTNVGTNSATYTNSNIVAGDSIKCLIQPNFSGCSFTNSPSEIVSFSTNEVSNSTKFYISVDTTATSCLLAKQNASFTDLVNISASGNNLIKYYYSNGWDGGAVTLNKINNNSYVYTVVAETNTGRFFGLSSSNADADYTSINYAFYLQNGGTLNIYETGSNRGAFGTYTTGDTLKIAVEQSIIRYYKNSTLLYESSITPSLPLLVDVCIGTRGGTLNDITIVNGTQCNFYANATNAGSSPHYQWKVNGINVGTDSPTYVNTSLQALDTVVCVLTPDISGCTATQATSNAIVLKDAPVATNTGLYVSADNATTSCLIAKQQAVLTELKNVVASNNNLTKYYNTNAWDAGAISLNKIYNNTTAYTIINETNTYRVFGLSSSNTDENYTSIQYSYYIANTGLFYVFENGNNMGGFGAYSTGDTLKIAVESGKVNYYRNSQFLYQSNATPTLPLMIDVSFYTANGTLNKITILNNTQCSFTANTLMAGTNPHYQWKLNNTNVGTDTSNYYNTSLVAGDSIICMLTPDLPGCSSTNAASNLIALDESTTSNNINFYVSLDTVSSFCLQAKQRVNFTDLIYLTASGNNLTKYFTSGNWDGGAASLNKVTNNSYAYTVVSETNTERMFGLSSTNTDENNTSIQYAIYLVNNSTLQIYESGSYKAAAGSYATGDTLKIGVEKGVVRYYKNSTLIYESAVAPSLPLIVDVSLRTTGSTLNNITVVAGTQCHFYANASNAGTTPHYQWKLNSTNVGTDSSIYFNSGLQANDTIVCILTPDLPGCTSTLSSSNPIILEDANVNIVTDFYISTDNVTNSCLNAKQNTVFTNLHYVASSGNNLTKYYNSGGWDGGAISLNKVNDNSYAYTIVAETNTQRMFGLSASDVDDNYTSIQYAFYLVNDGSLYIYEGGNSRGNFGTYNTGDTLKIVVDQGEIYYYIDDSMLYKSNALPTLPLMIDVSLLNQNSTLNNITIVNRTQCSFSANALNIGSTPHYQWVMNGVNVGSDAATYSNSGIVSGDSVYCLLTPDLPGCASTTSQSNSIKMIPATSSSSNFYISTQNSSGSCYNAIQKADFKDIAYVDISNNNISKSYNSNAWNAGVSSYNKLFDNGYIYTIVNETNTYRMFGLSTTNTDENYISIQYAIYLVNNATVQIYENGTNRGGFGTYATGDTMKIAVEQSIVKYYKNSTLLYTSNSTPSLPLTLDVSIYSYGGTLNSITLQNGTQGKFDANAINAGSTPHYQWQYNGVNVGSDTSYYYNNSIADNDSVLCLFTPGYGGCSATSYQSNVINVKNAGTSNSTKFYLSTDNVSNSCLRANISTDITDTVHVALTGNNLTKNYNSALWDAGAASLNKVNNFSYAYTVVAETNTERYFGLSSSNSNASNTSIQYAFYLLNTGSLQIYESGTSRGTYGTYATGDTLKLYVYNGRVRYYKNSTLLYTSNILPTLPLFVDVSLFTFNSTLQKVTIVNGTQGIFYANVTNAGSNPQYQWRLNSSNVGTDTSVFIPNGPVAGDTISCTLTPDLASCSAPAITSNNIILTNTPGGALATITVTADTSTSPCLMAIDRATFTDSIYVTVLENNITKYRNTAAWDAGIASTNKLYNNSYAYTVANETNTNRMFGLSHVNINTNYTSINYALYLQNTGNLYVYENGNNMGGFGTYTTGDTLKIAVENGVIRYYKNSSYLYESSNSPSIPLIIDASLNTQNSTLNDLNIVYGTRCNFTATNTNGGTNPSYQWYSNGIAVGTDTSVYSNNGLVANDSVYCVITPGTGTCSALTATSNSIKLSNVTSGSNVQFYISADSTSNSCFLAKQKVNFTNNTYITVSGNNLSKYYNSNNWDAGVSSFNKVNNNGYAYTVVAETNTERFFGLSSTDANKNYTSIDYGMYLLNNATIQIYERGSYKAAGGGYATGDTLKIAVEQGKVKYYKNSTLLYESTTLPTLPLLVDISLRTRYSTINEVNIVNNTSFAYHAIALNAGAAPHYQWKVNSVNVGTDTSYYSNIGLGTTDTVECILYPDITGCTTPSVTSNPIIINSSQILNNLKFYISPDTTSNACLWAKMDATLTSLNNVSVSGNNLTRYYPTNNWDGGAISLNKIYNNGYAYTVANEINTYRMFGLSYTNTNNNYNTIQYAIYLVNDGSVQIYENGNNRGTYGTYITGDTMKVAVVQGKIKYYKNSTFLYQSAINPILPLIVDVSMYSQNSTLQKITVVNGTQCKFTSNASGVGINPGYQWILNGGNVGTDTSYYANSNIVSGDSLYCKLTPDITGCASVQLNSNILSFSNAPASNTAKLYVSVDTTVSACLVAKQKVNFTNTFYVDAVGNNLTKYYNNNGWNAGASSLNKVNNNSTAYTIIAETNTSRLFGLSHSDPNVSNTSIQYAFYLVNDGSLQIYENGTSKGVFGTYATSDTMKISVVEGKIKYYKNSSLLYESMTTPSLPLIVDVSLGTYNSTLNNITIENGTQCKFYANAINAGTSPHYQWKVNNVNVGTDNAIYVNNSLGANDTVTCTLSPDISGCSVTTITSNPIILKNATVSNTMSFYVAVDTVSNSCILAKQKVNFTDLNYLTTNSNNLTKYYNSTAWNGGAASLNKVYNNSYAYTIVSETNTYRMFGLSKINANNNYTSIQYAIYLVNDGTVQVYENGTNRGTYGTYATGDTMKIAVESGKIKYYKNSTYLYQSTSTPVLPLIVDVSLYTPGSTLNNITIVNGTQCNFTGIASNAGTNPHYQWKLNGVNTGTDTSFYYNSSIVAGDSVYCIMTPDYSGCASTSLTSNSITLSDAPVNNATKFYVSVDTVSTACLLAKQMVNYTDMVYVNASVNDLTKFYNSNNWDAGAASLNKVNNNSYAYTIVAETNTERFFGLSYTNADVNYTSIQYAFYLVNTGALQIYELGANRGTFGTYSTNDTIKIGVEQSKIRYYKNSTLLYESNITPSLPLIVDVSLRTVNSTLKNITVVNGSQCYFYAKAINAGVSPTYQWKLNGSNVDTNTDSYTNSSIVANDYITCTLTPDFSGCNATQVTSNQISMSNAPVADNTKFYISVDNATNACLIANQKVNFTDMVYVTASNNDLLKYYNSTGWDGGAASLNKVNNNTYVYTIVAETNTYRMFGLSNSNTNANYTSIQYAFYLINTGALNIYESGTNKGNFGTYTTGDTLKIAVESNTIKYYKNSLLLYQSATSPTLPLIVDVSLYTPNSTLKNITIVNNSQCYFTANATGAGSSPHYQWVWNNTNVGADASTYYNSSLVAGDSVLCRLTPDLTGCSVTQASSNTVKIADAPVTNTSQFYITVDNVSSACLLAKQVVSFTNNINLDILGNDVRKYTTTNLWDAGAASYQKVNNNSYAYTVVAETNTNRFFGLSSSNLNANYTSIQYAFYLLNNATIQVYENGTNKANVGSYASGDTLKIAVDGNKIKYYKNSTILYESSTAPILPLLVDLSLQTYNSTIKKVTIVNGTQGTFTAYASNAGTVPHYQWKLNGVNVGTDNSIYTNSTLTSGDTVLCALTPDLPGCSVTSSNSNPITIVDASPANLGSFYITVGPNPTTVITAYQTVTFKDVKYLTVSNNNLTKYTSGGAWTGGAATYQKVNNNSYAYTVVTETNLGRAFGLSTTNTGDNLNSIQYAVYLTNGAQIQVYESGVNRGTFGVYATGDTIKVKVISNVVKYYRNSTLLYTSAIIPTLPLLVDVSLYDLNATLKKITIVDGSDGTFQAFATNGGSNPTYQWQLNGGNVGTNSNTYINNTVVTGDIVTCSVLPDIVGCNVSALPSNTITLNVNPLPAAAGIISGSASVCQGQTGVNYSVAVITYATGYVWNLPSGASITSGSNTNSITVSFSAGASSGNITVYGTNSSGNGTISPNFAVTANSRPIAPTALAQSFCGTDSVASLTCTPPIGSVIDWYAAASGGSALSTSTILATGNYYAESRNSTTGCISSSRTSKAVIINPLPSSSVLTGSESTICNGSSTALQVTITGGSTPYSVVIANAGITNNYTSGNNIAITPASSTSYSLTSVTDNNGCLSTGLSGTPTVNVLSAVSYGIVSNGDETICNGGDPSDITLSSAPGGSGSFAYQWYYQDGIIAAPSGSSTLGWTLIGGATSNSYNPPSGLTGSRTYALMVIPGGSPACGTDTWATGVRQVSVLPSVTYGTLTNSDETICNSGDPSNITLSAAPAGSGSFTYQWYYQDGLIAAPSGSSTTGWTLIGSATTNSYNPPSGLTTDRTYAVMVAPAGSPTCGTDTWATGARQVTVLGTVSYGTLTSGDETICEPGDPSNITMSSAPIGSALFTYQWYYQDGIITAPSGSSTTGWTSIGGATANAYNPPSGLTTSRTYALLVTPGGSPSCGTATWATGCRQVTINSATNIISDPSDQTIFAGQNTDFGVSATGTGALSYAWEVSTNGGSSWNSASGGVYTGETTDTLHITAATLSMDTYLYHCVVSASCGTATSGSALLTVNPTATATINGTATICSGDSTMLSITLTGTANWSITYDDGVTPSTVNNIAVSPYTFYVKPVNTAIYTITAVSDVNGAGTINMPDNITITVNPKPATGNMFRKPNR